MPRLICFFEKIQRNFIKPEELRGIFNEKFFVMPLSAPQHKQNEDAAQSSHLMIERRPLVKYFISVFLSWLYKRQLLKEYMLQTKGTKKESIPQVIS